MNKLAIEFLEVLRRIGSSDHARSVTVTPDHARLLVDAVTNEAWLGERVRTLHTELDDVRVQLARMTATRPTDSEHESTDATPLPSDGRRPFTGSRRRVSRLRHVCDTCGGTWADDSLPRTHCKADIISPTGERSICPGLVIIARVSE